MAKEKQAKEKKGRAKRDIVVLEEHGEIHSAVITPTNYEVCKTGLESSAAAKTWIRKNGESLKGKTLRIASLSEPMVVRIETVSKVNFE